MERKKTKAFGVENSFEKADLILLPAPWEATASYGRGASEGPELVRQASFQLDFFNLSLKKTYNHQIHFAESDSLIESLNKEAMGWAQSIQKNWEDNKTLNADEKALSEKVNQASQSLLDWIYEKAFEVFRQDKIPALIGGDHSVSEGLLKLVGERLKGDYGILHIDAHADLRESYQGFTHSHASVMHNVLNLPLPPKKLVQVGIRDLEKKEYRKIQEDSRIECFFAEDIHSQLFSGSSWTQMCETIIKALPSQVYVSLDVDGLSWPYAPGTGTPVPGGLSFQQLCHLFSELKKQKKKLVAFDVVETSAGHSPTFREWNGNVSARLIYYLAGLTLWSAGKLKE